MSGQFNLYCQYITTIISNNSKIYQDITTTTSCVVFSHYRIYKELFVDQSGIDLICVDPTVHIFNYLFFDQNVNMTVIDCRLWWGIIQKSVFKFREGVKKLDSLGDMSPIQGGGGFGPPPPKKSRLFQQNVKIFSMTWKTYFFIKTIFLYCHPCLRIGSNKIFIKKGEKKLIFFVP